MEAYMSWKPDGTDQTFYGKKIYGSLIFKHSDKADVTWVVWIANVVQWPEKTSYRCRPEDIDWDSYHYIGPLIKSISEESIKKLLEGAVPAGEDLALKSDVWARNVLDTLYLDQHIDKVQYRAAVKATYHSNYEAGATTQA